jgi:hypothetical protein
MPFKWYIHVPMFIRIIAALFYVFYVLFVCICICLTHIIIIMQIKNIMNLYIYV